MTSQIAATVAGTFWDLYKARGTVTVEVG